MSTASTPHGKLQIMAPPEHDPRPLRETIRDKLRAKIIDGTFQPGHRIVERDVAAAFNVSRLPVREAIRMLGSEGFVEVLPTRGVIVKKLSRRDVLELFDVREALESLVFRRAAERATKKDVARLLALRKRAHRAITLGDDTALHELNEQFHDAVGDLARNTLLTNMLEPLAGRLHWIFRQNDDPAGLWHEHDELLTAITEHDGDTAAALAINHVNVNRERALVFLFGRTKDTAAG